MRTPGSHLERASHRDVATAEVEHFNHSLASCRTDPRTLTLFGPLHLSLCCANEVVFTVIIWCEIVVRCVLTFI